jgi:hypothetical protein
MNRIIAALVITGAAALLGVGCSTYDKGPYLPEWARTPAYENSQPIVLLDPAVQYSVTYTGVQEQTLPDGRLQVVIHLRNRENRRIEVQANCVFKDVNFFLTGDETPFQTVILTENSQQDLIFTSMNDRAKRYTIRVRQAR